MAKQAINRGMFRAYDIRGTVGEDLTDEVVGSIGLAIGTHLLRGGAHTVVAGHDARLSSPAFHEAMVTSLCRTGLDVVDIGLVPTPLMYFAVARFGTDGGVMITASHNPPQFNGIKVRQGAQPLVSEGLQQLADLAVAEDFERGDGKRTRADAVGPYIDTVSRKFRLARPIRVVVDCGNGCAGLVAPQVLAAVGCDVVVMYQEPDGHFPNHHPDPMKEANLADVKAKVRETGADLGLAFDGDGDRLGIVDDLGETVTPNEFLALLARQRLPHQPGSRIVFEVKVSQMLIEEVERLGGKLVMTRVGYPFILAAMREYGAVFGGEMSGHYYFDDPDINFDDGTYTGAVVANMVAGRGEPFSDTLLSLPRYPSTPELVVRCSDETKFAITEQLTREFAAHYDVVTIDGARVLFADGWGVVRPSNTEPRLTLRFEAHSQAALERIMEVFRRALRRHGLEPTF